MNNEIAIRFISHKRTIEIFVNGNITIIGDDPQLGTMNNRIPLLLAQKDSLICEMFQVLKTCRIMLLNRDQNELEMKMGEIIKDIINKVLDQKVV